VKNSWGKPGRVTACVIGMALLGPSAWGGDLGPDPAALAKADALLSYCAKVTPTSMNKYWTQVKLITKDTSKEQLAAVRRSDEYRKAHQAVDDFVAKVDAHNARLVCGQHVTASK
jgi:hypothetical protein